ncbi:MAG TPA: DNA alkylation repair protein [Streptosporangiaceae bacterium]|nr:DNA alkylation repair protein [Streptosporangiaceae bacterium]
MLCACIEPNLADPGFFLRKGIGWALRAYAWVDPAEVARYVAAHADTLSGLSRREALKNISRTAAASRRQDHLRRRSPAGASVRRSGLVTGHQNVAPAGNDRTRTRTPRG